jgi:hypothetical protein
MNSKNKKNFVIFAKGNVYLWEFNKEEGRYLITWWPLPKKFYQCFEILDESEDAKKFYKDGLFIKR